MALGKSISKPTGHANAYWRLAALSLDVMGNGSIFTLAGYKDAAARQAGGVPDDGRQFHVPHARTLELASINVLQHLAATGVDTSAWPAEVRATLQATTIYNQLASACYAEIKAQPRQTGINPVNQAIIVLQESEFADAADV